MSRGQVDRGTGAMASVQELGAIGSSRKPDLKQGTQQCHQTMHSVFNSLGSGWFLTLSLIPSRDRVTLSPLCQRGT